MQVHKLSLVLSVAAFAILGIVAHPSPAAAAGGTLTNFSYSAGSYAANATTTYTFSYTTATSVSTGNFILYVLFPYVSATPAATYSWNQSQIASNVTVTVNGVAQTISSGSSYVAGSSGLLGVVLTSTVSSGSNIVVTVQNIHNSTIAGTYTWDPSLSSSFIKTANSGGGTIDGPASISALVLTSASDTTPPSIAYISPASSSVVAGTSVSLSASASDNVAVAGVTFYVDGTKIGSEVTSGTAGTYTQTWDSTATSTGTHTAFAVARDTSNNYASSTPISFMVDNAAPVISTTTAIVGGGNTSATISWNTDKMTSSKVYFGPTSAFSTSTPLTDTSPYVTSHSVTVPGLLACTAYLYEVVDADALGNTATSSLASFITGGCETTATVIAYTAGSLTSSLGATKTLVTGGHTISAVYPAGVTATSTSLGVQIKALDGLGSLGMPSPSLLLVGSSTYELKALIDATTTLTSFALPVTITESYTPADISGINESTLTMYHYHGGTWSALTGCTLDTVAKTVSCPTLGFSTFALFGAPATASVSSSSGGSRSGGGIIYGCKDPLATNYSEFVASKPSLCTYKDTSVSPTAISTGIIPDTQATLSPASQTQYNFTRNMMRGMSGSDVTLLQKFLIAAHAGSAATALAKAGTSTYFGSLTKAALIEYQTAHGILPASGNLGPLTRAYIASHA